MAPSPDTVLLTGIPRSGTTLCCHLLNKFENTLALHEPIDPSVFNTELDDAVGAIVDFSERTRETISVKKKAVSKQIDGRVPDNPVSLADDGTRREAVVLGDIDIEKPLDEDFILIIKHNALFTALSKPLRVRYPVYALVRNPLPVLASWRSVNLPVGEGLLPMGQRFSPVLESALDKEPDLLGRQLEILQWFFGKYREFDRKRVLTYENLIATQGELLSMLTPHHHNEAITISAQFKNSMLPHEELERLADLLTKRYEIYEGFYSIDDIRSALDEMLS